MIRTIIITVIALFAALALHTGALAQNTPSEGTWGIRASIQSGQGDIIFPYQISGDISIGPLIGISSVENVATTFRLGGDARFYQQTGSDFATYIGGRVVVQNINPSIGDGDTDVFLGFIGGGEYFLSPHFGLGVEGRFNLGVSDPTSFSTGAAVTATYYF